MRQKRCSQKVQNYTTKENKQKVFKKALKCRKQVMEIFCTNKNVESETI